MSNQWQERIRPTRLERRYEFTDYNSLRNFLAAVDEYQIKVADWRTQIADLIDALPTWIDRASISLTVFLFWFGLSQFGLLLHGRMILRGQNPLDVLRG